MMLQVYNHNGIWVCVPEIGLDYESARDATPQWFAVARGNGNDGVPRSHPDCYVRTSDPWQLAEDAIVNTYRLEWQDKVRNEIETEGEREYTVSAYLYDPPNWTNEEHSYSEHNGAYDIVEVTPLSDEDYEYARENSTAPFFDSLKDFNNY